MEKRSGINIVIEHEKQEDKTIFIASSTDINVFAEGDTIDEAKMKFIDGAKTHLEIFPEDRKLLIKKEDNYEMPLVTRIFL